VGRAADGRAIGGAADGRAIGGAADGHAVGRAGDEAVETEGLSHLARGVGRVVEESGVAAAADVIGAAVARPPADDAGRRGDGGGDGAVFEGLDGQVDAGPSYRPPRPRCAGGNAPETCFPRTEYGEPHHGRYSIKGRPATQQGTRARRLNAGG